MFMKNATFLKLIAVIAGFSILVSLMPGYTQARAPITIEFDQRLVQTEVAPIIVGGRTLVPLRVIFEILGADVAWDEITRTVTGRKAGNVVILTIGNRRATLNGTPVTLDQAPRLQEGRTLVPLRFVGEAFGALVAWDEARQVVQITSTEASRRRSPVESAMRLTTGGASFPFPLYTRLITEYANLTRPTVQIEYASVGSGAGVRGLQGRTFQFAGSDRVMTDAELLAEAPNTVLHIPTVMGAVAVVYNVAGVPTGLRLAADVLADIFLGIVTRWNDARIVALNPGISLPSLAITVVHRSDASGTTFIFTDYLAAVSDAWRTGPGVGTSVAWPSAGRVGARGNEGVSAQVGQVPGAIGYVELNHAVMNRLNIATLRNRTGNFIAPSVASTTAASAALVAAIPADMRTSLVNSPAPQGYPIIGLTWILIRRDHTNLPQARAMIDFLRWAVVERNLEPFAEEMLYAPLPQELLERVRAQLQLINYHGVPIWR